MESLLRTAEVAGLLGCTDRAVRKRISKGLLPVQWDEQAHGYLIPVSVLPPEVQTEYYKRHSQAVQATVEKKLGGALTPPPAEPLDHFTAAERQEIGFWLKAVEDWQTYRNQYSDKGRLTAITHTGYQ